VKERERKRERQRETVEWKQRCEERETMIGARRGGEREQTTWSICVYKPCRPGVTWPCFDRNLARQHERANLLFYVVTDDDGC